MLNHIQVSIEWPLPMPPKGSGEPVERQGQEAQNPKVEPFGTGFREISGSLSSVSQVVTVLG
jgi:hypothetical protein